MTKTNFPGTSFRITPHRTLQERGLHIAGLTSTKSQKGAKAILRTRATSTSGPKPLTFRLLLVAIALSALVLAPPAGAVTPSLTVTKTADTNDGICDSDCSLREAISRANTDGQNDTINFAPGLIGSIILNPTFGSLVISDDMTIDGPGANVLSVDGNTKTVQPFFVDTGVTTTIGKVLVTDGSGGIRNSGTLTLNDSTVSGNTASGFGGGIENNGILTLTRSTVSGNTAQFGGGISSSNFSTTITTITNSTISGNTASGGAGGGIDNVRGLAKIENSTITNNTAAALGSGVASAGNTFTSIEVFSSIVSANANDDDVDFVNGTTNTFKSKGFNLIGNGNATATFNQSGDHTGVTNPLLGTLTDNGSPTQTHALLAGSPAIDTSTNTNCPPTDQRGEARPADGNGDGTAGCDMGAFEKEAVSPPPPPPPHHKKHHHKHHHHKKKHHH